MPITTTADPAEQRVQVFCKTISSFSPILMAVAPRPDCEPLDCFFNVRRQVEKFGGEIRFGWSIWEWPRVYLEAEHHAVYDPGDGSPWVDVTPAPDRESYRLFLPDEAATYDFDRPGLRRDNIRKAISADPAIKEYFALSEEKTRMLNLVPGIGEVSVPESFARSLMYLEQRRGELSYRIGMKHTPRNAVCFCGSGQKFKHCHGRQT
jgi:hypothetical protein